MLKKQFDVYIENKTTDDDLLALVKFPAMKSQFEIHDSDQIQLSVKPKSMKLKLDVDLKLHSREFNKERAEALARTSKPQTFPNKLVDKNFYTSTKQNPDDDEQLFVCKAMNNKLVCQPISHIIAMRTDLSHFDLKDEIDVKEEIKPVSVKMATDRHGGQSRRQQESKEEAEEGLEEYQSFRYKDKESAEAIAARINLFGRQTRIKQEPTDLEHQVDAKPIIPDIKPKIEKMDVDDIYSSVTPGIQSSPKQTNIIRKLVKECLTKAKLVNYEEVYRYVEELSQDSKAISNKDIIDALNEYAVLVQGNWAIKSEILYGDSGICESTAVTGIPINLFTASRDYLLWLFNQDRLVSRTEFSSRVKIPDYDIIQLFNQLADFRRELRKWELKLPEDQKFIDKFPEVVQRQQTFWKVRRANKLGIFSK